MTQSERFNTQSFPSSRTYTARRCPKVPSARSSIRKSRPAWSSRSYALSIPRKRSGNKKRWSILSRGPCCCSSWCLLVTMGVARDAVKIFKTHLTWTSKSLTHTRANITTRKTQVHRSHEVRTSVNYQLTQPLNPLTNRHYPKQADRTSKTGRGRGKVAGGTDKKSDVHSRQPNILHSQAVRHQIL